MQKLLTASLIMIATLFSAGQVAAKKSSEISPHGLGERSILSERAVEERLKPVGSVCVEGEECGTTTVAAAEEDSGPRSGEEVYDAKCSSCHATGAAGAPKTGDADAWGPRIAQGEETLFKHAIEGLNAMPPKGMCTDCSDDEIKEAVKYIVGKSE